MDSLLRQLNGDIGTKEALLEYITRFIAKEGVRRIFAREDIMAVADAKELIDKAFEQLSLDYGIPTKQSNPINEAR